MNKRLLISLGLILPVFVLTPLVVTAQEASTEVQTTTTEEEKSVNREELKARVDERKANLKTRLAAAKQARIKTHCKASQGNISNIRGRIKGLETSRSQVYENLLSRLDKLSDKLQTHNVDTTELDGQITELTTLITAFNSNLEAYKTAVGDLADMDCAADPAGFQASLETARIERANTAESAKAIRTFLSETIKPTLKDLRQQFAEGASTKPAGEAESENENENESGEAE